MTEKRFTDDYLLYLLAQASAEASAQFHAELAKIGIPVLNWRIFATLYPSTSFTIGDLARDCLSKQTTVTRAVDRLEYSGEVERYRRAGDRRETNCTELRAVPGNFLYSTGANEFAGRFTRGHFDLPMMGCTIALDGNEVVRDGKLV